MTSADKPPLPAAQRDDALVDEVPGKKDGPGHRRPTEGNSASLRPVDDGHEPAPGDLPHASVDLTVDDPSSAPTMPHERDESVGMTDGIGSERVEQAFDDVEAGRRDTTRATETDRAYQRQKKAD